MEAFFYFACCVLAISEQQFCGLFWNCINSTLSGHSISAEVVAVSNAGRAGGWGGRRTRTLSPFIHFPGNFTSDYWRGGYRHWYANSLDPHGAALNLFFSPTPSFQYLT